MFLDVYHDADKPLELVCFCGTAAFLSSVELNRFHTKLSILTSFRIDLILSTEAKYEQTAANVDTRQALFIYQYLEILGALQRTILGRIPIT